MSDETEFASPLVDGDVLARQVVEAKRKARQGGPVRVDLPTAITDRGAKRSHSAPASMPATRSRKARRPSVRQRLTFPSTAPFPTGFRSRHSRPSSDQPDEPLPVVRMGGFARRRAILDPLPHTD